MKRLLLLILFLSLLFAGSVITLYTDYVWFVEVGYTSVFRTALKVKAALFLMGTVIAFLLFWINVRITRGSPGASLRVLQDNLLEIRQRDQIEPVVHSLLPVGMVAIALFAGVLCASLWEKFLRYANPTAFDKADPLFGKDIGFYVFQLPLLKALYSGALVALGVCFILSVLLYIFDRRIAADQTSVVAAPQVKPHLFTLLGLMLLVKAWGYRLSMYDLLYSSRGVAYGASYTDVHVDLPVLKVLLVVAALCAAVVLVSGYRRGWKLAAAAVGMWVAVALIGGTGLPVIIQKLHVTPNELSVEQPYIKHNIGFTRAAYSLDNVEEKEFAAETGLTSEVLQQNDLTVQNIRLWDYSPLLAVYKQLQEIRTYYDFNDVDVDRYMLDGKYRQVMLSAREISSERLPSKLWINEHLSYTHGYGAVVSPVNRIVADGLPDFLVKNIPPIQPGSPRTDSDNLKISRPEVYYGESLNDYVFVNTKAREFDYPAGEKNVYSTYAGDGGVPVGGFLRRVAFALRFRSLPVLLNDDITAESRVMFYRRVHERLRRVAPFLFFDNDPYLVVSQGKLLWMCDAYTVSEMYPYSQPVPGMGNYIRNSVKAVVAAYDGAVTFYVADASDSGVHSDPILRTYAKIFPRLFQPLEKMDPDLRKHLRYPQALFEVQARMYAVYHMDDPQVFYNKEDVWEIPAGGVGDASAAAQVLPQQQQAGGAGIAPPRQSMEPYYTIMRLPDAPKEEFIQLVPFTPASKDNLRAWMCARSDPPHYGKLLVYNFPKAKLVYGPSQINARIEQEADISQQLTLWRQGGSDVMRGNLLIIPIEQSLLYVQSLYMKAAQGEIPELKRVIAAYGDQIVMETNLERSLTALFGEGQNTLPVAPVTEGENAQPPATAAPSALTSQQDRAREALQHLQKARESYRRDDWAGFGAELKKLEETLRQSSEEKK